MAEIFLYNTLTRKKESFRPIDVHNVRVYACGPTVYSHAHIGNAVPVIAFDLLVRVLRWQYGRGNVRYVRNITDIDDKIIAAAGEAGEDIAILTEKYARIYNEDMALLGAAPPDAQPRATDYVPQMIGMIERLVAAGNAYEAEGHVLFHVPSYPAYGQLSGRNRDDMIAGARVEVAPYKKDPADFVLWKPSAPEQPGWDSPWGRGRPGWHIECSAMNEALNGETFDIHAGGGDLIFPHHENEIAQSVCAHGGKPYANYWVHNGHLTVEGRKMSKSLGNFLLVHDLVQKYPPEALRLVLLSAHYRQPFDFTHEAVMQAKRTLDRYYGLLRDNENIESVEADPPAAFMEALLDDLNTPKALAELAAAAKRLSAAGASHKEQAKAELRAAAAFLGLLEKTPEDWFRSGADASGIELKLEELKAARAVRDYTKADGIRAELQRDHGVLVSIGPDGVTWRKE